MTFADQIQIRFTGLEKDLNLPAFSIDPNDFFFGKLRICADEGNPVLLVVSVADTDDPGWNLILFPDHHIHGKKIFAPAAAFLADAIDFLYGKLFSFILIIDAGTLSDHGYGIQSQRFDCDQLYRSGKPGIEQDIVRMMSGNKYSDN